MRDWKCVLAVCVSLLGFFSCKKRPENCIIVTIDTCRADHLGCYGYEDAITPRLDAFAEEGVLFEECVCPVPVTFPSHASLFSGQYPNVLGLQDNTRGVLREDATTLAELFKEQGYNTAAFIAGYPVEATFGLDQGFMVYDGLDDPELPEKTVDQYLAKWPERPADSVTDSFLGWLEGAKSPFFAWIHYYDPRAPYNPPEPFASEFRQRRYDGEIAFVDREFGRVMDRLKEKGFWDRTLFCVTSDHGEDLGEHGEGGHSIFLYDATLRVPLLMRWPGVSPAGTSVPTLVRLIDLFPTIVDIMRLQAPKEELPGRSLASSLKGKPLEGDYAYAESFVGRIRYGWTPLRAIRTDKWKYVDSPSPELYDLGEDNRERVDVAKLYPDKVQAFRSMVASHSSQDGPVSGVDAPLDPERVAKLKQLGYVGMSGTGSLIKETGVVPKDMKRGLMYMAEARSIMRQLPYVRDPRKKAKLSQHAAERLMVALSLDPKNPEAGLDLAILFISVGRFEDGLKSADQVLSFHDQHVAAMNLRASCLGGMGRHEEALSSLERAIRTDPAYATAKLNKILLLREAGRQEEALLWAKELREDPTVEPDKIDRMLGVPLTQVNQRSEKPGK